MTFFVMAALLAVNLTNVTANFAGIAGSLEIFEVNRYISVPLGALAVWLLVVKGTYRSVEKIFLVASAFYVAYVISAVMIEPDWGQALQSSVIPVVNFDGPADAIGRFETVRITGFGPNSLRGELLAPVSRRGGSSSGSRRPRSEWAPEVPLPVVQAADGPVGERIAPG